MPVFVASWFRTLLGIGALGLAACQQLPQPAHAPAGAAHWTTGWQSYALPGKSKTVYSPRYAEGRWVLHAQAERSASMFRRSMRVDPDQLGDVVFSWKVPSLNADADVRQSDTEDAVVRVVLAFDGDHGQLSPRNRMMFDLMQGLTGETPPYATLMYVWDTQAEVGSVVVNKRTDRIRKIVLESGTQHVGQWREYRRDIRADYRRAFGEDPGPLIGVAVMTDADNTQSRTEAWYGEIRFE
jgi:hypothetical protein